MASRGGASNKLPFWIHQLVEYLIGILLVSQALQADRPLIPLAAGAAVLALAATADGPLGAFRFVGRHLHHVLDLVVGIGLLMVAVLARDATGSTGVLVTVVGALSVLVLAVRTEGPRAHARRLEQREAAKRARSAPAPGSPLPPPGSAESAAGRMGRALGKGIRTYRDDPS